MGAFLPQPAGAHAKLLCSALFVEGRSLDDARAWAEVPVPVSDEKVDLERRTVTVTVLFHTRTARHQFCRVCGIHSFYVPRSDPDKIDVNVRCLDGINLESLGIRRFDGRNWEQAIKSRPPWE